MLTDALVPMGGTQGASAGPSARQGANMNLEPSDPTLDQPTETGKPYDDRRQPDDGPTVGAEQ